VAGIPTPAIIALVVFVLLHLMLTRTRLGRKMFAVGGNAEAAAYAGIKVGRIKLVALMLSGLTSGIGGLILRSRLDAGNGVFGAGDLLGAVAAVVIGGTSLFGGMGSIAGTATGVLIITTINNGMVLLNVQDFWQQIVVGWIIVAAVMLDQLVKERPTAGAAAMSAEATAPPQPAGETVLVVTDVSKAYGRRRSPESASRPAAGRSWGWSATTGPGRPRWSSASPGCSSPTAATSWWTARPGISTPPRRRGRRASRSSTRACH
jgi:hypothetical protein